MHNHISSTVPRSSQQGIVSNSQASALSIVHFRTLSIRNPSCTRQAIPSASKRQCKLAKSVSSRTIFVLLTNASRPATPKAPDPQEFKGKSAESALGCLSKPSTSASKHHQSTPSSSPQIVSQNSFPILPSTPTPPRDTSSPFSVLLPLRS